jgi:hypothetical protein
MKARASIPFIVRGFGDGFEELARSLSSEGGTRLAVVPKPRKANQS